MSDTESDYSSSDEEEERLPFFEWSMEKLGKGIAYGKTAACKVGVWSWYIGSTAVIIGLPLMFAHSSEMAMAEMMKAEQARAQGAPPPMGGVTPDAGQNPSGIPTQ